MPVLGLADDLKVGADQVDKVYLGATQVWPSVTLPTPFFDLDERHLDGGTLVELDAPLAADVLDAIPTWSALSEQGVAWGVQVDSWDIVSFVKRPSDDSIWASEWGGVGSGKLTGATEPDWDTDPESGVADGDYTWYPVDASFPTIGSWEAGANTQPCRLIEAAGFVWASYPDYSGTFGATEPAWTDGGWGEYVSDGSGYWWPVGAASEDLAILTVWPDQSGNGRDAIEDPDDGSDDLTGFLVGTTHGHTTVTGGRNTRRTIKSAFPAPDADGNVATVLELITLSPTGRAADGTQMTSLTFDPSGDANRDDVYSTAGDPGASSTKAQFSDPPQTGGPQPGATYIQTRIHNTGSITDGVLRCFSHLDGFEATPQTKTYLDGDIYGPDVMIGNYPGGDFGLCGRIRRVVCYPGALTKAQRLAARQMLQAQAAADGITVTLYDETDPSDIAIDWEPTNAEIPGLLDVWYPPDDAVLGADVTELVGVVNGEELSNNVAVGTIGERVSLDGVTHKTVIFDGTKPLIHPDRHTFAFTREDTGKWWIAFAMVSAADFDDGDLVGNEQMVLGGYVNGPADGRAYLLDAGEIERAPHSWRTNYDDLDHGLAWCVQYDNTKRTLSTSGDIFANNDGQGISLRSSAADALHPEDEHWNYAVDTLNDTTLDGADPANYFNLAGRGSAAATGDANGGVWAGECVAFAMGEGSIDKAKANLLLAWMHRRGNLRGPFLDLGSEGEVN